MKASIEEGAASDKAKIAKRLREARESQNLTQAALAARAGLSRSAVVNYENEKAVPGGMELMKLARALDSTPNFFLSGSDQFRDSEKVEHFLAAGSLEEQIAKLGIFLQVLEPPTRNAVSALVMEMVRERIGEEAFRKLVQAADVLVPRVSEGAEEFEPALERIAADVDAQLRAEAGEEGGDAT